MAPLKGFLLTLLAGWAGLSFIGLEYARFLGVPAGIATAAVAAFLIAYGFYLIPAFPAVRNRAAGWRLPAVVLVSTLAPYLAACAGAIQFEWASVARLAGVALVIGGWYLALPHKPLADAAFGGLIIWLVLGGFLEPVYPTPFPKVQIVYLGKFAILQSSILVLMVARRQPDCGYGFIPNWREWGIGILHFAGFVAVALPLALAMNAVKLVPAKPAWLIAATFLAFLWVGSLTEEFLFRGVLQGMLERATGNRWAALGLTSLAFGLVHLPFGHKFPNWPWVALGGILGLFCGHARNRAGGIRAAVVAHALVVAAYKGFFASP